MTPEQRQQLVAMPVAPENDHDLVSARIAASAAVLERLREPAQVAAIVAAAETISLSLRAGGKLLLFGNGGSAADAQHIAAEFLGRFLLERASLPALCLSDNAAALTAIGNDYAYADVFARQIAGLGAPGDVALAISTSGSSPNVLAGVAEAHARDMRTIGLTGAGGGALADAVDLCIAVPSDATPRIQEAHTVVAHLICEMVERDLATGG
ncbi:MAG TPA: SIS domain-containing protein [Solirubrobacteraceae bacterium]|nr:SIS domain-containing protein [Solirubrobacteraceae bacterium]